MIKRKMKMTWREMEMTMKINEREMKMKMNKEMKMTKKIKMKMTDKETNMKKMTKKKMKVEYIMTNIRGRPLKRARSCSKFQIYKIQLNICVFHLSCHTMFFRSVKCTK